MQLFHSVRYLDVLGGLEAVQLIEQLQHRPLHLTVTTWATLQARRPDGVDLVHEDDGGGVFSSHDEQLAHHAGTLRKRGESMLYNQIAFDKMNQEWKWIWLQY